MVPSSTVVVLILLPSVPILAGILSAGVIVIAWPWLKSYALARPGARSSHLMPTPQGGGFAVVLATLVIAWGAVILLPGFTQGYREQLLIVTAATMLLALVG